MRSHSSSTGFLRSAWATPSSWGMYSCADDGRILNFFDVKLSCMACLECHDPLSLVMMQIFNLTALNRKCTPLWSHQAGIFHNI